MASTTSPSAGSEQKGDGLLNHIADLRRQQKEARDARAKLSKELKNATRKKKRLQRKARQLSNQDLLQVLSMREASAAASPNTGEASAAKAPAKQDADETQAKAAKTEPLPKKVVATKL